jgi:hypothetical protein
MAGLEMTANDHYAIGSTPPKILLDNPGKTLLLETMNEAELRAFIAEEVTAVTE